MNFGDGILVDPSTICSTNWKQKGWGALAENSEGSSRSPPGEFVDDCSRAIFHEQHPRHASPDRVKILGKGKATSVRVGEIVEIRVNSGCGT